MLTSKISYLSYLINCIALELISGQTNESAFYENNILSQINFTSNRLLYNTSVVLDSNENIVQINENSTGLSL